MQLGHYAIYKGLNKAGDLLSEIETVSRSGVPCAAAAAAIERMRKASFSPIQCKFNFHVLNVRNVAHGAP